VASELLGHGIDEILGRPMTDFVAGGDQDRVRAMLAQVRASGERSEEVANTHLHKDGQILNFTTCCMPRLTPGGAFVGYLGTHRDVSREIELEEELRHSQKMDAIGRLAGGVAHDFNNLLTVILGCCRLIVDEMTEKDPLYEDINMIRTSGERAAQLTKQLLAFGRKQILFIKRCNMGEVVRNMEELLRRTLREDIDLRIETGANLPDIEADADQLQQVIVHLAVNAREAMVDPRPYYQPELWSTGTQSGEPRIKRLTIKTEVETEVEEGAVPRIILSVSDTGVGMPEDVQQHVFEPFFTTKEVGQGSGLGLPTVYGIVTQMNGEIAIQSVPGEGTTVQLFFTPAKEQALPAQPKPAPATELEGEELILVVEDNATVRKLMVRMLTSQGYRTEEADNGRAALEMSMKWEDHPPNLVLTDMVMPEMTGRQLVERLRETQPDVRVLFMSGYSREEMVAEDVLSSDGVFLQKPFTRDDLLRKVRHMLDT
jgi:PAS domain S-box-containing protein